MNDCPPLYQHAPYQTGKNEMLLAFRASGPALISVISLSEYCRGAGSCAANSVTSLAQQIANQPFWEQQWVRPRPPLLVHQGSGTNGSQPRKVQSTHSAQTIAWRNQKLPRGLERAGEDQVQLWIFWALVGICCWSLWRNQIKEGFNLQVDLVVVLNLKVEDDLLP